MSIAGEQVQEEDDDDDDALQIGGRVMTVGVSYTGSRDRLDFFNEVQRILKELGFDEKKPRRKMPQDSVTVNHYYYSPLGGLNNNTIILRPHAYGEIRDNYDSSVMEKTDEVIKDIKNDSLFGKLVLLHGEPGTGKTTLLTSMMRELNQTGYSFVVITNPSQFFTDQAYYYSVISQNDKSIFILEDVEELFDSEAKKMRVEEVSNFLNMTDGILGEGRKDVFFCTFNYDLKKMDQAMTRGGRSMANINFPKLTDNEALALLEKYHPTGHWKQSDLEVETLGPERQLALSDVFEMIHRRKGNGKE
jgi:hypothetical protein